MRDTEPGADVLDVRDLIARFEQLEPIAITVAGEEESPLSEEEAEEFAILKAFLESLSGNGGDEEWRGDWYPVTLIRDSYFEDYARELAEDIGAIADDARWPCTCIDWKKAAWELRMDYTSAEYGDSTYWYR